MANTLGDEWTNARLMMLMGSLKKDGKGNKGERSGYNMTKWKYLLDAPFNVGSGCCDVMKKRPSHAYAKQTGLMPMVATMAEESKLRTQKWLQQGCNTYEGDKASSKPISFWTEQDVLLYIYLNKLPIASVYGDVLAEGLFDYQDKEKMMNAMLFDLERPYLETTGVKRTGCMFCLYGIHLEDNPNRLERMKETHPKQYNYIMKPESEGGLGYKDKIDWLNEHSKKKIKY